MELSYILNELAEDREDYFRAVSPPIVQTSNFAFKTVDAMRKSFEDEYSDWLYSRGLNPTVEILRKKLAALDGAEDCLVFNSGSSAIFASVLANVKSGDHILSVKNPYTWAKKMFEEILPRFQVTHSYIDGRSIENFEKAIQPNTTVIYLESPNSWTYELQDLTAVAQLAKSMASSPSAIIVIVRPCFSNRFSWASIWYCNRPLNISMDIVIPWLESFLVAAV